jgi:hypothetical protein
MEINIVVRDSERCFSLPISHTSSEDHKTLCEALFEPNSTTVAPVDIRWRQDTFDTKVSK